MTLFRSLLVLVSAWAALSLPVARGAASGKVEAEIAVLDGKRVQALLEGNLAALEKLYSDDLVYVHSAGRVDTKRGYLGILAAGNLKYESIRYDPAPIVRLAGPDTALVNGRMYAETSNKAGQRTKHVLTTTTVYVRTPRGWQVVSYQGTRVQP